MSRQIHKLSTLAVQRANKPGRLCDGGGLYLQVTATATKSWLFRFMLHGRSRDMGLGSLDLVSISEAREIARQCRRYVADNLDPIEQRNLKRLTDKIESTRGTTFDECAKAYIDSHRAGWRNAKHADQWKRTLETYASPLIGSLPVQVIDTHLVMKVLQQIWGTKTETASRVRNRIELILDYAKALNYRTGENPARWRGHLDKLLPKRSRVQPQKNRPALPVCEMQAFINQLRARSGIGALALEFLILTAARTGEVLNCVWEEFDLDSQMWTIPAERMKAGFEHRVPLSPRALEILALMKTIANGKFVFPGARRGRPMSNVTLLKVIKRMNYPIVSHGFRSTFRDWAAENTNFSREVVEAALAHRLRNKVEAAYFRSDVFMKRKLLMNEWAEFCAFQKSKTSVLALPNTSARPLQFGQSSS